MHRSAGAVHRTRNSAVGLEWTCSAGAGAGAQRLKAISQPKSTPKFDSQFTAPHRRECGMVVVRSPGVLTVSTSRQRGVVGGAFRRAHSTTSPVATAASIQWRCCCSPSNADAESLAPAHALRETVEMSPR